MSKPIRELQLGPLVTPQDMAMAISEIRLRLNEIIRKGIDTKVLVQLENGAFILTTDARLTDKRQPLKHADSHQNGGEDEINVGGLSGLLADPQTPLTHSHPISAVVTLQNSLDGKEVKSEKGQPNGYAPLGTDSIVPAVHLPPAATAAASRLAYVLWEDVEPEVANKRDVPFSIRNNTNSTVYGDESTEVEIVLSESSTNAEPTSLGHLEAAASPEGTVLAGAGTATLLFRCGPHRGGEFGGRIGVVCTTAATLYLWVKQGANSSHYIRADQGPLPVAFV